MCLYSNEQEEMPPFCIFRLVWAFVWYWSVSWGRSLVQSVGQAAVWLGFFGNSELRSRTWSAGLPENLPLISQIRGALLGPAGTSLERKCRIGEVRFALTLIMELLRLSIHCCIIINEQIFNMVPLILSIPSTGSKSWWSSNPFCLIV